MGEVNCSERHPNTTKKIQTDFRLKESPQKKPEWIGQGDRLWATCLQSFLFMQQASQHKQYFGDPSCSRARFPSSASLTSMH